MSLTPREQELLSKAVDFTKSLGRLPTTRELYAHLHCRSSVAANIIKHMNNGQPSGYAPGKTASFSSAPKAAAVTETVEATQDTQVLTLPKTRIHTLEELLAYFKVDADVWEVDHWICNKWEMGYKDDEDKAQTEELYQVKVWLRRRMAQNADEYAVLCATQKAQLAKARQDLQTERSISKRLALNHSGYDDVLADFKKLADQMGDLSI
jgi:hypothetical protein